MVGKLLVLEGTDGAGKATQVKLLKEYLERDGYEVLTLSYPDYNNMYGKIISDFLHFKINLGVEEQFFVYLLDMIKDKPKVSEALQKGDFVIMDRYFFSTLSYQCSNGFDYGRAKQLVKLMELTPPFAAFYIDVPVEISMERKQKQKTLTNDVDKFERDKSLLIRVKSVYEKLMKENSLSENWIRIDGSGNQEFVSRQIISELTKRLPLEEIPDKREKL